MRKTNFLFSLIVAAGGLAVTAQNQTIQTGSASFGAGIHVKHVTVAEPGLKGSDRTSFGGGFAYDAKVLHRWMTDRTAHAYFGYDMLVEPIAGSTQCRVSILPLSLSAIEINKRDPHSDLDASWTLLRLPMYPAPQLVEPSETIALDLLVNPDGKQKVVDYLQASCEREQRARGQTHDIVGSNDTANTAPARDFTIGDVVLNVTTATLYVNGQMVGGMPVVGDASGPIVWFYFPGKGRFLVSVAPQNVSGFQKAGMIRGGSISFDSDGNHYEIRGTHSILGNNGAWNAYVLFDPLYQPKGSNAEFGGGDSVDKLLKVN